MVNPWVCHTLDVQRFNFLRGYPSMERKVWALYEWRIKHTGPVWSIRDHLWQSWFWNFVYFLVALVYGCPIFSHWCRIIQLTVVITAEQCNNNPYAEKHSTPWSLVLKQSRYLHNNVIRTKKNSVFCCSFAQGMWRCLPRCCATFLRRCLAPGAREKNKRCTLQASAKNTQTQQPPRAVVKCSVF